MQKQYKYVARYLIRRSTYQEIHPLRDAAFDADRRASLKILKIVTVSLKMDSSNSINNCHMLHKYSYFNP